MQHGLLINPNKCSVRCEQINGYGRLKLQLRNDRRSMFAQQQQGRVMCSLSQTSSENVKKENEKGQSQQSSNVWSRLKNLFGGGKIDMAKLKELGSGALISYGFTSNVTYGIGVIVSWITYVRQTGVCPLAPGHWQGFLAVYAGMFVLNNIIRPIRFTVAIALTPFVNQIIISTQQRLKIGRPLAFTIVMVLMGLITTVGLFGSIWILGGFPPQAAMTPK
eukprot:TRINITY_DN17969_c0_g2_i2.p1 TRINITY_DN17969_c0_g2~~TRINITY_DN17969_c0_g2_i2.p1  ORF type:complete len:220 (-),score=16.13 TRINITY_DN17969_c0_g2_i2:219-878(-)